MYYWWCYVWWQKMRAGGLKGPDPAGEVQVVREAATAAAVPVATVQVPVVVLPGLLKLFYLRHNQLRTRVLG